MYYIYIIRSDRLQKFYAGSTEDIERRLHEHNAGKSTSTRTGRPWKLVYTESAQTRSQAMAQEKKIKGRGIGRYLAEHGVQLFTG